MGENDLAKLLASIIIGLGMTFSDKYGLLILLVIGAVIIDIFTGLVKGKIKRDINSRAGYIGFWKKVALFTGLGFGLFLDAVVGYFITLTAEEGVSLFVLQNIPFGHIIGIYIILNESISIMENLHECGIKMPNFIIKIFRKYTEEINQGKSHDKKE